jgi:hypothetical protein
LSKITFVSPLAAAVGDELDGGADTLGAATFVGEPLSGAALVEGDSEGGGNAVGRSQPAAAVSPIRAQVDKIHFIARFSLGSTSSRS